MSHIASLVASKNMLYLPIAVSFAGNKITTTTNWKLIKVNIHEALHPFTFLA